MFKFPSWLLLASAAAAAPSISVNTSVLTHGAWVHVTFSGIPSGDGFLAVYYGSPNTTTIAPLPYPAVPPWTASAAAEWVLCTQIAGCSTSGAGAWDFQLFNSYEVAEIWVFSGTIAAPLALVGTQLSFSDSATPRRTALIRTLDPTEMYVSWNSLRAEAGAAVQWGSQQGGPYPLSAPATSVTYTPDDLCGPPASKEGWFPPHAWNRATMTGLQPGAEAVVYYRVGSPAGWSAEMSFRPAPEVGPQVPTNQIWVADVRS